MSKKRFPALDKNGKPYTGIFYRFAKRKGVKGTEKVYYAIYKKEGKVIETKLGRQYEDHMTPFKASHKRAALIEGREETRKEKREALRRERNKIRWTVGRIWQAYLETGRNTKSRVQDENRFKNYLLKPLGDKLPAEIIPLDIERIERRLRKEKAPATVRHVLELFRRVINFGVERQYCQPLPFKVKMPRVDNIKTECLTPDQIQGLLKAIKEDPHPVAGKMLLLALYTGMRRGEIFHLKWEDIDFKQGFILLRNPKGGKPQRIPINDGARRVLESVYRGKNQYVFPGRNGGPRSDIRRVANRIRDRAGLPKSFRPFHGLRHTFASALASSGRVDIYTLQKLLTHKSPQMTQRYAHLADETLKRAAAVATTITEKTPENIAAIIPLKPGA